MKFWTVLLLLGISALAYLASPYALKPIVAKGNYSTERSCEDGFFELKFQYPESRMNEAMLSMPLGYRSVMMGPEGAFNTIETSSGTSTDMGSLLMKIKKEYVLTKVFSGTDKEKCFATFVKDVQNPKSEYAIFAFSKTILSNSIPERRVSAFAGMDDYLGKTVERSLKIESVSSDSSETREYLEKKAFE